ncbi:hypothetical protein H0H93_014951, partial [Arthromyces matolae]
FLSDRSFSEPQIEKATKKRRGGRPSLTTIADEPWLERTVEIFQSLDNSSKLLSPGVSGSSSSRTLIPPSTRTLRDRKSRSSTPSASTSTSTSPQPQRVASSKGVRKELEKATGTGAALERSVSASSSSSSSSSSTSTSAAELKPISVGASGSGSATPTASSSSSKKVPRVILRLGPDPNAKSS